MSRFTEAMLEQAYDLIQQGCDYKDLSETLGYNRSSASSLITCFDCAAKKDVIDLLAHSQYLTSTYTVEQLSDLVEEMFLQHYGLWQGVMKFKIEYNKLNTLITLRKKEGHKLTIDEIKTHCKWAGKLLRTKQSRSTPVSEQEASDAATEQPVAGIKQTQHSTVLDSQPLSDEELQALTDKPRIFGKAKVMPRHYRGPKKDRNKSIVEAKKQQDRIKQRIVNASQNAQEADQVATCANVGHKASNATSDKSSQRAKRGEGKATKFFPGHPASKYLDAQGNFKLAGKRCRLPYIDPSSEGFDKLPYKVQVASCLHRIEQLNLELAATQLAKRPRESLTTAERYKIYLALKGQFTKVKDSNLLIACGLDPSHKKFYAEMTSRPNKYDEIKPHILDIYEASQGKAGRITIAVELRKCGIYVCDQTVRKIMIECGLKADPPTKVRYNSYQGEHSLHPNLLERDFTATRPLEKLVTDVSMIQCKDIPLYVSMTKDLYTKRIWCSVSTSATTEMVLDSIMPALELLQPGQSCIIHSDQGVQYQSDLYQQVLRDFNVTQSMSRKGNCYDNGACESMFGIIKTNVYFDKNDTFEVNCSKLLDFCNYYNRKRTQTALNGMSPMQFSMLYGRQQACELTAHSAEA